MPSSLFSFSILFLVFLIRPFTSFVLVPSPSSFFLLPFLAFSFSFFLLALPCSPFLLFSRPSSLLLLVLPPSFFLLFALPSPSQFFFALSYSSFFHVTSSSLLFLRVSCFSLLSLSLLPPLSSFLSLALHFLPAPCSCWLLKSRCFLEPRYPVSPSGWVSRLVETGHCDSSNNTCGSIMINLQNERESED